MPNLVQSYGKYKIFVTTTGDYIVRSASNQVVYTTKGLTSAIEWCKRH